MTREHRRQSLERRGALIRATIGVLAERGVAGVTHRAVTEAAGVPLATVSYFWSSIDELTSEAVHTIVSEETASLAKIAANLAERPLPAADVAAIAAKLATPRQPETIALLEAHLDAARSPQHREAVIDAIAAFRRVAEASLAGSGLDDASAAAAALVALCDGFTLQQISAAGEPDPEPLERALRAIVAGFLVEQGDITAAAAMVHRRPAVASAEIE